MTLKKRYRYFLAALLFFLVVGLTFLITDIVRKQREMITSAPPVPAGNAAEPDLYPKTGQREISLYFVSNRVSFGRALLEEEKRAVEQSESIQGQAQVILEELGRGSQNGYGSVVPAGAQLLHVFIAQEGIALVDYSRALVTQHPGGLQDELASVYAIVNTLTRNLPVIESVRLLVEGEERKTLVGHVDISGALKQDLSFVRGFEHLPAPIRTESLPP